MIKRDIGWALAMGLMVSALAGPSTAQTAASNTVYFMNESLSRPEFSVAAENLAFTDFFQAGFSPTRKGTTRVFPDETGQLGPEPVPVDLLPGGVMPIIFRSNSPIGKFISDPVHHSEVSFMNNADVSPENLPPPYMRLLETPRGHVYVPSGEQIPQEYWQYLITREGENGENRYHFNLESVPLFYLIDSLAWTMKNSAQGIPGDHEYPWQAVLNEPVSREITLALRATGLTLEETLDLIANISGCNIARESDFIVVDECEN